MLLYCTLLYSIVLYCVYINVHPICLVSDSAYERWKGGLETIFFLPAAFKCAYCFTLNPARKTLPTAPRIERQNSKREDPEEEEPGQPVTSASANNRREEHKEGVEDPKELGASASANSRREELKEGVEEPKEFGTSASANSRREEFEEDEKKSEEDLGSSSLAHKTSISHPGRPSEVDELTVPTNEEQPVIQD